MKSPEIVQLFLEFFAQRGHTVVPSSSLIPAGDPTLLFTNAGMVQFKHLFEAPPFGAAFANRLFVSVQKCFRTTDIDRVGDTSHLTFFEMLGNFSIGDYFKEEAILMAWEFVTKHLGLPSERLWISIFLDDDEAFDIWRKVGVPAERIVRLGKEDNFWGPAGETGPSGPDSEIFYDRGPEWQKDKEDTTPSGESERFLEIWNLVFMQYHQDAEKKLHPLPSQNIDTGMGLERISAVMQGVPTVYETDLFWPIIERASRITGAEYKGDDSSRSLRIIAEHGRAATFLIADGVMPANEGRGYVLRRILRKAIFHGRRLGREEPFLWRVASVVVQNMGPRYPDLFEREALVLNVIKSEEERFHHTLEIGAALLSALLEDPRVKEIGIIPGEEVFRLYDTYGLPVDFTRDLAGERGLKVDEDGFQKAMEEQKERARTAAKFGLEKGEEPYRRLGLPSTKFVGDKRFDAEAGVLAIVRGGQPVNKAQGGEEIEIVLHETPFYGEAGGQVGDTGWILGPSGSGRVRVQDTQNVFVPERIIVHYGRVEEGTIQEGDSVKTMIDEGRRWDIMRNHTATHLLHKALREVLGPHALQAGSLVAPDRLRFDFTHSSPLTQKEWEEIEQRVNEKIRENFTVEPGNMPYREAIAAGAVALFGEKYGDEVRVISINDYSRELCGGTHLSATGQIGFFIIVSEGSVGAGVRRLEALTGRGAEEYVRGQLANLQEAAQRLETSPAELPQKLARLLEDFEEQKKKITSLLRESRTEELKAILEKAKEVDGVRVISRVVTSGSKESLREMSDWLRERAGSAAIVLGAQIDGRNHIVVALTPDLIKRGLQAGELVKRIAQMAGGSGGGRPNLAEGGGGDPAKLKEAVESALRLIAQELKR